MADKTYIVKITTQAEEQLQAIVKYIDIENSISSLSQFPQRVALTEEEPWRSTGIHKMPVKNFPVYFWIDEENSKVQVTAVIYGRRDQINQLSQMDME